MFNLKFSTATLVTAVTFVTGSHSLPLFAESLALEELIVTAQRKEQSLQDVPVSVTAFNATQLEERGISTIVDLEKSSPNTQMRESRGTNSTLTAFIRAVGQQDPLWGFEPGVGIYVDDVYIARPQAGVLDVYDVERIEILRGPQGTLYGKNTIGGAVKYVTASLSGETKGAINVSLGDYGQKDLTLNGQMPIVEDKLFIGAAIAKLDRDGFGVQYKDYDPVTGEFGRIEENYNKDILSGRVSVQYKPTEEFSLRLAYDKTSDDSNNRCGSRFAANLIPAPNGEFFEPLSSPYDSECGMTEISSVESEGYSLTAQYDVNDALSVKYIYADREGSTDTFIDFDGTPLDTFEVPAIYRDEQETHELQFTYLADRFSVVGGLYYYDGNAAGGFDALFGQFSTGVLTGSQFTNAVFGDVDTESKSAFFNGDFELSDTLTLTAGIRYTNDDKAADVNRVFALTANSFPGTTTQGSNVTFGATADTTVLAVRTDFDKADANNDWSEINPSVKLSWDFSEDAMAYAGWSQGFKSGGFDMRADAAVEPNAIAGYDPEIVDTYEIGIKSELWDSRLRLNAAIFRSDFEDMQLTVQAPAPAPAFFSSTVINAGKAQIDGLEVEGIAQLAEGLTATFSLGLLDAEFIEVIDAVFGNVAQPYDDGNGNILPAWEMQNAPDVTAQLALAYNTDIEYGSLALNTSVSHRGDVRMFDAVASILDQSSYSLWDAGATWYSPSDKVSVGLQLKNITDERFRTGGYNFPATAGEDAILGFYGAPRTWSLNLKYQF